MFVFRYKFRRLCLCFGMDFKLGFGLCLHFEFVFRAGFLLVVLNLLVSIWVAHISTLFFGFSDLGFAYISAHFFWFFCSFFFFFWFFFTGS